MPETFPFRRIPTYTLVILSLLVTAVIGALYVARSQAQANAMVTHTIQVEVALGRIMERARAVESAMRGYVIAQHPWLLEDFSIATADLQSGLSGLNALVADNPVQVRNAAKLKQLIDERVSFSREIIEVVRSGNVQALKARDGTTRGRKLSRAIAAQVAAMSAIEDRLFNQRRTDVNNMVWWLSLGLVIALALVAIVAAIVVVEARRRFVTIAEARDEASLAARLAETEMKAREAAEGQVRQMQKMESIGQLTGGIAHDFNNMLAIVIGSLDLAERRLRSDPDKAEKSIGHAREGAERAATLTGRLLAFSRQQPLAPVPIDPNKLVSSMSELLRRTLGEQISVETVLAGGLWPTFADASQLENAILNLAVNARDAMPEGGRLTIETGNSYLDDDYAATRSEVIPGQYVVICLSDSGSGMTPAVMERAFDPFFTTKEVGKGTGLGLSQVFGFVKQSGGHIAIYSEIGEGTTVKLYLPRFQGNMTDRPTVAAALDTLPEGRSEEVLLVVEDEQRVRHFSVDALRDLGYTALSAANGAEALKMLEQQPQIAMLFTDIVMPEMNGRKLADAARALKPDIKILYTTGYTRNAVVHNGMLDAGVAFLPKPFTIAQLAVKIRAVLDGQGINRVV
jgi:signal transduction histidine kinase/ActR/RegA family two-component response regulator